MGAAIVCEVQRRTVEYVDDRWAGLFGIDRDEIWRAVTVRPHALLGDYGGFFVAWRGEGVHVSLPAGCPPQLVQSLSRVQVARLQTDAFWHDLASTRDLTVIGPSAHQYLDVDPGPDPRVVRIDRAETGTLQALVTDEEWSESGFDDDDVEVAFGLRVGGRLAAAATLSPYADQPRDVGVLVAPEHRGHRLVDAVGRTAASYAIREHGLARWVARTTNHGSTRAARRLGFEAWCVQLAVR